MAEKRVDNDVRFEEILFDTEHRVRAYIAGMGVSLDMVDDIAQEVYLGLLTVDDPWTSLQLLGKFVFETSYRTAELYYTPIRNYTGGGGLSFGTTLPVGTENALGLYLYTMGSLYRQNQRDFLQLEANGTLDYYRGEAGYSLSAGYSTTIDTETDTR